MKIRHERTIKSIYDENDKLIDTYVIQTCVLVPEENEKILDKRNLQLYDGVVGVGTDDSIDNYEAVKLK